MQNGTQTDVIVMDFSKAFDKIGYNCLIKELQYYGIFYRTQYWITDFLGNRS